VAHRGVRAGPRSRDAGTLTPYHGRSSEATLSRKIGKYEVLEELGKGAMGTVYKARDPVLERLVALKTVHPNLLAKGDTLARFQREARAAAKLQHANIVTIYELGEADEALFIAMELLEGHDLAHSMVRSERLTRDQKLTIVIQICRGLDYAHKQGVFHRDVKPANVHVRPDYSVKLVDFGIARLADSSMTQTGLVLGTPSYIAPEALLGARVDHRADMWAVGVILYELLAGRRPYESPTITSLVYRIVHEPLPPLDAKALRLPPSLVAIAHKALSKDPNARFRDLADMAAALEIVAGSGSPRPAASSLPPPARERAYERNFAEARELLAQNQLDGALAAARRALTLEPSRTGIVALISVIEEQLRDGPTIRRPAPAVTGANAATAVRLADPTPVRRVRHEPTPTPMPMPTPIPQEPPPGYVTMELRARGASAFRELATFGEPPATQTTALSPAKDLLVLAGSDGGLRLWDLTARTRVATLRTEMHQRTGHDALALCLAFSTDGALLASDHVDGSVHLWDVARGEEASARLRHDALVGALAFSPDGSTLATGSVDSTLRRWDVGEALAGKARRELHRQPAGVTALAYAGGGDWILTGHANRVLRLQDARTGRLLASLRGPEGIVSLLVLAPDGLHVAAASHDRTIRLFDLATREPAALLAGLKKPAVAVAFLPDGEHLISVGLDNSAQLWDIHEEKPRAALWGLGEESFAGVAVFRGGNNIAVALADGRIRVWGPAL
jgi:predicted Ser/Thr protein kinase